MPKISFFNRLILAFCRLEPFGLSPWAPGTCGSFLAVVLAPFIFMPLALPLKISLLVAIFFIGGWAASRAERILGKSDPGSVVIDELLGQWISLLPFVALSVWELLIAFGLFRLFDITKPWPVKASENWLPGGFGIMLDDVFAGIYALLSLFILRWVLLHFGFNF